MTAPFNPFEHQLEQAQQQFETLVQQIALEQSPSTLLSKTCDNLSIALEEIQVLLEELTTQQDQLQTTQLLLQTERQQYFELFDLAPDGYLVTNVEGVIEHINQVAATLLNRRQSLLVGKPIAALLAQSALHEFYTVLTRLQQGRPVQNVTLCLRPYQQPPIYACFTIAPVRDSQNQLIGFRWLFRDLTEQRQAAMALKASEQRYATLAAAVPVGIFRTDRMGHYLYVNERWCQITGLTSTAAAGEGWKQGLHPNDCDRVVAAWEQFTQAHRPFQLEYRFQRPDGQVTWVYGQSVAEHDADGQMIGYVGSITDISALKQAQALITYHALHDPLTHLPNRHLLLERLELTIKQARRHQICRYAVLFLDLDRFKLINDSLGHGVGDQLLTQVAQKLKTHLRDTDLVARLGGDEFLILLEEINSPTIVVQIAERILADCQMPFIIGGREIFTSLSIGIVLGTSDYHQATDLIRDADIAMYRAKAQGKNSYRFFDALMHTESLNRLTLETELRRALDQKEFTVYYQPIVDVFDHRLVGFEALVRWQHPSRGLILPDEFVPIAEEIGVIVPIDHWVFHQACQQMVHWQKQFAHLFPLKISINFSAQNLLSPTSIKTIDRSLADTGLAGDAIVLEITESMLIEDLDQTIDVLAQLASRGILISLDDFGTGYSSLTYLHRLPVDTVKIDRTFVSQMQAKNRNYQVVSTIITLSNQLGLTVVAEGIETSLQLQQLQQLGCQSGQGYLFSKPLAPHQIEAYLLTDHG
ncbi:MAG: EAL domain-containing protein [Cyanobacteria bacterium P01_G01_bin.54]